MAKLWDKGYELDPEVQVFTVGDDYLLDRRLARYDILGSLAHAEMLASIGILSKEELSALTNGLLDLLELADSGKFEISQEQEDVHTAVEEALVERLGDIGKKLHAGRSRNGQIILDLRLYTRDRLVEVWQKTSDCAKILVDFARKHEFVPMPGRSHTQRAMPSSVGTWAAAFAESLLDNMEIIKSAYRLNNQCPLGSAAGYGVCLPIDRQMTTDLLGFEKLQNNVLCVQNSRGKFEAVTVFALSQVVDDLARLAGDTILFSVPEFGYFSLPEEFCPGSSIMPQKKNPDPLELVRAKASVVSSLLLRISSIVRNLPSGYNRDLQETKGPLIEAFDTTLGCLTIMGRIFQRLGVNEENLRESFSGELFAADAATRLAADGVPFREAYKRVASQIDSLDTEDPEENIRSKAHAGAPGSLGLKGLAEEIEAEIKAADAEGKRLEAVFAELAAGSRSCKA